MTQRGNRRQQAFFCEADYEAYIELMAEWCEREGVEVWAYCLMDNHVHLVATPSEQASLGKAVGGTHFLHSQYISRLRGRSGHLWQNRFYSCALDEPHTVAAVRYVERNPVRAGLVRQAWEYEWSSARYHVGLHKTDPILCDAEEVAGIRDWRELLRRDPAHVQMLREKGRTGGPCGSQQFMQ